MEAGAWVLTEGNFQFPRKAAIIGPTMSEDPIKTGGGNGPVKKTSRVSAGVHSTLMCVLIVEPG